MINASLKNPVVEGNLTILEIMYELDKLRQENEQLKTDNVRLHNMIEDKYETKEFLNNNNEGGFTEDEFTELARGYADFGY